MRVIYFWKSDRGFEASGSNKVLGIIGFLSKHEIWPVVPRQLDASGLLLRPGRIGIVVISPGMDPIHDLYSGRTKSGVSRSLKNQSYIFQPVLRIQAGCRYFYRVFTPSRKRTGARQAQILFLII